MNRMCASNSKLVEASDISNFLEAWLRGNLLSKKSQLIFNKYYASYIKSFSLYMKKQYKSQTEEVMDYIDKYDKPKLLEIGSGCGTESLWFALAGADVVSIDIRNDRLSVAKERLDILNDLLDHSLNAEFVNRSILELDPNLKKFDIIWMEQAFHHLEPRDKIYKKIGNLLNPGGVVIISETNAWNLLIQFRLIMRRGFNTKTYYTNENGVAIEYGNERIIIPFFLSRGFSKVGIKPIWIRYFRVLPNGLFSNALSFVDGIVPKFLKPLFSHYNYVGEKQ